MTRQKPAWRCRACGSELNHPLIDLGLQPDPDVLLTTESAQGAATAPIDVWICDACGLVQLVGSRPEGETPAHGHRPALGLEGARDAWIGSLVDAVPTGGLVVDLDVDDLSSVSGQASLIQAGHALSHVDDIEALMTGIERTLAPAGRLIVEFHHVLGLAQGQFDVLSHAHRSYLSLHALERVLARHGFEAIAAELVGEYGGSVRVVAARRRSADRKSQDVASSVEQLRTIERDARVASPEAYGGLRGQVDRVCSELIGFLEAATREGRTIGGYGAAARGTALLNVAGVNAALLPYVADQSSVKQGKLLPGSRIPVVAPAEIDRRRPDAVLILPWPLAAEIAEQLASARRWGARFVLAMPNLGFLP